MIYFYDGNTDNLLTFPNAIAFTAYLDTCNLYDYVVDQQRLTATDVIHVETPWESKTYGRNVLIYDEYERILDVHDFAPEPKRDYQPIYNEWVRSQHKQTKHQKQGRAHEQNGHYKPYAKFTTVSKRWNRENNEDCYEYAAYIRHKSRWSDKHGGLWKDRFAPIENNWKNAKVRKQYMWHQKLHQSTSKKPSFKNDKKGI